MCALGRAATASIGRVSFCLYRDTLSSWPDRSTIGIARQCPYSHYRLAAPHSDRSCHKERAKGRSNNMEGSTDRRALGEALGWWIAGNIVAMTGVCLCAALAQAVPGGLSWPLTLSSLLLLPFGQAAVLIDYIPGMRPKRWMGLTLAGVVVALGLSVLLTQLSDQGYAPSLWRGHV